MFNMLPVFLYFYFRSHKLYGSLLSVIHVCTFYTLRPPLCLPFASVFNMFTMVYFGYHKCFTALFTLVAIMFTIVYFQQPMFVLGISYVHLCLYVCLLYLCSIC